MEALKTTEIIQFFTAIALSHFAEVASGSFNDLICIRMHTVLQVLQAASESFHNRAEL